MSVLLRISQLVALLAVGCLLGLSLLTICDVIGRYLFGRPIPGFNDIAALATAVIVSAFFPILLVRRGNVTLRPFGRLGGPRLAHLLDTFGALITAAFFSLMAWQYVLYAAEATRSGERMAVLRWAVGPWWWAVAAMVTFAALVAIVVLVIDGSSGRNEAE